MFQRKYTTVQGDMWDMISYKIYGEEHHIDALIQANLKYINVVIFEANIVLDIPEIELKVVESLPPWKRGGNR